MKRSFTAICILASAVGASSLALPNQAAAQATEPPAAPTPAGAAAAAPAGPSKVAVIVFQQAVMQTNEGQRAIAQLQQKFGPKQQQLKAQNDEIDSLKKQLQDSGATLSEQERETRTRSIDEKTKSLQRSAEDDQNDFNSEMNDAYQQLAQKVYSVMNSYANQQGYTVVLDASQQNSPVLWVNPGNDITKAVVDAYNVKSGVAAPPPGTAAPTTPRTTPTRPSTTRPSGTTHP